MFEYRIQKAWNDYEKDCAFGRIILFICFFNIFFFFISFVAFGEIIFSALLPVTLSGVFYLLREKIVKRGVPFAFALAAIYLTGCVSMNYTLIGEVVRFFGNLPLYDDFFALVDQMIFGRPVAEAFQSATSFLGSWQKYYYDFLQISYLLYYPYPIVGAILYFFQLHKNTRYKVGRYMASITIFFHLTYLFYFLVPVSGPQYYLREVLTGSIPLSSFGHYINSSIFQAHHNLIDCFPSGHMGMATLITIWMFRIKNHYRYIFLLFALGMGQATLALRYHYFLDVLAAVPMAILCFKLGQLLVPMSVERRQNTRWRF